MAQILSNINCTKRHVNFEDPTAKSTMTPFLMVKGPQSARFNSRMGNFNFFEYKVAKRLVRKAHPSMADPKITLPFRGSK